MRAAQAFAGQDVRGWLRVFYGPLVIAEVNLTFKVDSNAIAATKPDTVEPGRPLRRVFASYSHRDTAIVEYIQKIVRESYLGIKYLRDVTELRSGEVWDEELMRIIDSADMFQLFWSTNSMCSPHVRREYEYALARQLPDFVLPVYWEKPFPERPEEGLRPRS